MEHENKTRRRGPIERTDRLAPEEATPEEATPEEATPEEATPEEATPEEATPARAELQAKLEARAQDEPKRGPNPYSWQIVKLDMIPFGFRDPATGEPDRAKINEHVERCWAIGTAPDISGVLISERV
jgi:hypothetical protein